MVAASGQKRWWPIGGSALPSIVLVACGLLATAPVEAQVEVLGFGTEPTPPEAGAPFEILFDLRVYGCGATLESVDVVQSAIEVVALTGPPPGGGCGGAVFDTMMSVPVPALPAGYYEVEASFVDRRDGTVSESGSWVLGIGAVEAPTLSRLGVFLLATALGFFGLRRLAV